MYAYVRHNHSMPYYTPVLCSLQKVQKFTSGGLTEKSGNCNALSLEGRPTSRQSFSALIARHNAPAPAYKFNTSTTSFAFGDNDFLRGMDIMAIGGYLSASSATFSLRMCRNSFFGLPVKILTWPLHSAISATPIF